MHRAIAGEDEEARQTRFERHRAFVVAHRSPELERLLVMVDEDLRMVGDTLLGFTFDPLGGMNVLLRPGASWNLLVRDIAYEHVPERELLLVAHRREARRPDELASHEFSHACEHALP